MPVRRSRLAATAVAAMALFLLPACGAGAGTGSNNGEEHDRVKVILDFIYNGSYGPLAYGTL